MVDIKEVMTFNIRKQLDEVDKTEKDLARYQVVRDSLPDFLEACIIIMHICRVFSFCFSQWKKQNKYGPRGGWMCG